MAEAAGSDPDWAPEFGVGSETSYCAYADEMQARVREWDRMSGVGWWDERIRAGGRRAVSGRRAEHIPVVRYLYGVYESPAETAPRAQRATDRSLRRCSTGDSVSFLSPR